RVSGRSIYRHGAVSTARRGMSRYGKAGMVYNPPIKHRGKHHEIPDTRLTVSIMRHSTDGRTDKARTDHQPQDLPANSRAGQIHKAGCGQHNRPAAPAGHG